MSDNQSGSAKNWSFPEPSFLSSMRRKNLAGPGNEIAGDLLSMRWERRRSLDAVNKLEEGTAFWRENFQS